MGEKPMQVTRMIEQPIVTIYRLMDKTEILTVTLYADSADYT